MEGIRSASACSKIDYRGQNLISLKASHDQQLEALSVHHKTITGDVRTNSSPKTAGDTETSQKRKSKFCIKDVLSKEEQRGCAAHFRPERSQCSCQNKEISVDLTLQNSKIFAGQRLYDQDRHSTGILPRTNCRESSTASPSCIRQGASSDDELALSPLICPSYLCGYNELGCRDPSLARYEGNRLSGLPPSLSKQRQAGLPDEGSSRPAGISRLARQSHQMCYDSKPGNRIFGSNLEHLQEPDHPPGEKGTKDHEARHGHSLQEQGYIKTGSMPFGSPQLRQFRHPQRSASLPLSSKILHDLQTEEMEGKSVDSQGSRCRAVVVVQSHDLHLRPPQEKDHAFPNHRRGRYRMGSSIEWHLSLRKLVNGAEEVALESQEDVRSLCIDKTRGAHSPESPHPLTNRQSYTSGLYPEGRGHEVSRSSQSHAPITEISGQPPNRAISGLLPGEIQRYCRSSYQEEGSAGVASPPRSDKPDFQKVGRARHRPLCISRISSSRALCIQRLERSVRLLYRRIQSSMGMQAGMGVPTTQPDTQSPSPLKQMQRTGIDRGTQVGEDILDARPREEEQGTSDDHRETKGSPDRCHNATASP